MSGNFTNRCHVEPGVKLYSPRKESFPIPLKYIDVSRTTHTNLDVKQERRIDDYWNIDGSRDLSDSWTGVTQFILLEEKPPDGKMWSERRLTRKQLTSRPDYFMARTLRENGKECQAEGKEKWSHEEPQLKVQENYKEFFSLTHRTRNLKETIKNARKKLETPLAPAMPCKTSKEQSAWSDPW